MNLGIAGYGITGKALFSLLEEKGHSVTIFDPPLNMFEDFRFCDAIFICVPVGCDEFPQNLKILESVLNKIKNEVDCPIFIRSTILPGTCNSLREKYNLNINHLPEFLTERTFLDDAKSQTIYGPQDHKALLERIFGDEKVDCNYTNTELELAKYTHNCFGALKVSYFNMIYDICNEWKLTYNSVLNIVLGSGYINENHTKISLDGKRGYGGKCFPNNMSNFKDLMYLADHKNLFELLKNTIDYNERIRH